MINFQIKHILFFIYLVILCGCSFISLIYYPGKPIVYIIFTILLNALFVLGFTKKKIFFDTFIGIFFWLGFWLKLSVRIGFFGGNFHEPVGNFDGTGAAYDHALLVTCIGISALLIATLIRRKYIVIYARTTKGLRLEGIFLFYERYKSFILLFFMSMLLVVVSTNTVFGVYQRGGVPRIILPFGLNGVYTWLLLFGFASLSAVFLDCEFRIKKNPYLLSVVAVAECFLSNVSMLSRGMILNGGSLAFGVVENSRIRKIQQNMPYKTILAVLFISLFLFSVFSVNHMRRFVHSASPMQGLSSESAVLVAKTSQVLFLDRWVGIEGVMAVSSYPNLGWDLWKKAWQEKHHRVGTSMYDLTFIESPYSNRDMSKHHFISLPGVLAFFYYPGSFVFLFVAMFVLGVVAAGVEWFVYKMGGANIILCSLLAQVVASRYAHFGYVPGQSYLLFGSILLNVMIIYLSNKFLLFLEKK